MDRIITFRYTLKICNIPSSETPKYPLVFNNGEISSTFFCNTICTSSRSTSRHSLYCCKNFSKSVTFSVSISSLTSPSTYIRSNKIVTSGSFRYFWYWPFRLHIRSINETKHHNESLHRNQYPFHFRSPLLGKIILSLVVFRKWGFIHITFLSKNKNADKGLPHLHVSFTLYKMKDACKAGVLMRLRRETRRPHSRV